MNKPRFGEKVDRNRHILKMHNTGYSCRKIGRLLDMSASVVGRLVQQIKMRKQDWYKDLLINNN